MGVRSSKPSRFSRLEREKRRETEKEREWVLCTCRSVAAVIFSPSLYLLPSFKSFSTEHSRSCIILDFLTHRYFIYHLFVISSILIDVSGVVAIKGA